jgi:hypothetical protein
MKYTPVQYAAFALIREAAQKEIQETGSLNCDRYEKRLQEIFYD